MGTLPESLLWKLYDEAAALQIVFVVEEIASKTGDVLLTKRQSESESFCQVVDFGKWLENQLFGIFWQSGTDILYHEAHSCISLRQVYGNVPVRELASIV